MQDPAPAKRPRRGAAGQATQGPGVAGESARPQRRAAARRPRGASSTEAQLAEALARLELLVVAPFTAAREEAQTRRDEAVATFDAAAAAEKATLAARASEEKLIATLRRVLARALAGGGGEAPGLGWVCSALKAGCPCREGVRQKDAFPVDASWFRPNDAHAQAGRLFDEALQAYEEAVAAGRDDDAKAALLKLEGDKEATPKLAALRKALCAACRALRPAHGKRARRGTRSSSRSRSHPGKDCASDAVRRLATRDPSPRSLFQHTGPEPKPRAPTAPATARPDIGRVRVVRRLVPDVDGIRRRGRVAATGRSRSGPQGQPVPAQARGALRLRTQAGPRATAPARLRRGEPHGFCMCHTRDGAKLRRRAKGMNGVCIVGRNWDFGVQACADRKPARHHYIACPTPPVPSDRGPTAAR
ncbi:hypothetical protein JL721_5520 [Aureococcus anophagefferens]|nr:hypothetical protein JL721_5520 [Aureococcus anophagefferens]